MPPLARAERHGRSAAPNRHPPAHKRRALASGAGSGAGAFHVRARVVRLAQRRWTMANISAEMVKQLRDKTGAGMMECKAALAEANGNAEDAVTLLRKRGLEQAAKRAGRATAQGTIGSYIHMGGRIGVLVEVNCESDFVARTDDFNNLVKEVAMHIAAADPKWVRREDVPAAAIEKEKSIYRAQMENTGKPANVLDKIIEGKLGSFYSQFVLLDQPSIRDNNVSISQLIAQASAKTGENIQVNRFVRFRVGDTD